MTRIVNTVTVQTTTGAVEVTKTSTHRTYVEVTAIQLADGTQLVNVWHLTAEAGAKYRRTRAAIKIAAWEGSKAGQDVSLVSLPVFVPAKATKAPAAQEEAPVAAPAVSDANKTTPATLQQRECRCGCGEQVQGKRSEYRPGHDARHAGIVAHDIASSAQPFFQRVTADSDLGSDALIEKAHAQAERLLAKQAKKAVK